MSSPCTPQRKIIGELLLVSPIAVGGLGLSSSRRRQITPTAEKISPNRFAIITRPGAVSPVVNTIDRSTLPNPLRWPIQSEQASIENRCTLYEDFPNPLFQAWSAPVQQESSMPRHLALPFDLRDEKDALYDSKKRDFLLNIFPGTTGVSIDGFFLCLQQSSLPPKPWPLTVAGLPLYLTTELGQTPMPKAKPAYWKNGSIAEDRNGRDMEDWEPLFHIIKDHFRDIGVSITEVIYFFDHVYIVLEHRDTDHTKLPHLAAKIICFYMFEDEMGRPSTPHVRRLHDPAPGNPDLSQYDTLQPGLRVSSAYLPDCPNTFLATTTGVLLKDKVGNEFMTAAAHGFPGGKSGTSVWHPFPGTGRDIGELCMEVSHTDIALIRLHDNEKFSNITFQSDSIPAPIQLKKFVGSRECLRRSIMCLDSPDTGFIEGFYQAPAYQAIPSDDGSPTQNWVFTKWYYLGQDSGINLPQGMCGSAMWDQDGNVLGLFRYAPQEGAMKDWCTGIAADELINRGFSLVDTSDRT
ncbi:hypothetical protein AYL99_05403 [Fonsecaea erecta]|uniref:Uncharacterized protein n=1 Tax=Fonsecaea erecta TaxID=1367422 RepID=A0A178ZLN7_9EURO|nr:hypothetical protein AYL99_05403 [Fonsecaea erecta]OAP60401.1 hypothetical protein AYL99_05403 [Fonsecaea erecta]